MHRLACLAGIVFAFPALAQDKPPKTYPPDEATMKQIREKQKTLTEAIAKLPESPFKPDVEVYAKAVEWVTRHEEYWDAKSGEKMLAVLAAGLKRAEELAGWKKGDVPSWMRVRGKPVIRAYRSTIDGSVQPYAVTYPMDFEKKQKWRLDVVLHGRDATLTEVKFISGKESSKPTKESPPYVQLEPYGRGNNAYRWAGEADVFEARKNYSDGEKLVHGIEKFDARYFRPESEFIDVRSQVLRGFSMGGAGAWHIGLHMPSEFAVVGPGAGFSVTKGYVKNLPEPLPDYIDRCLHIYDAADYAENAFHIPVVAYAGDKDPQIAAARNVQERLKASPKVPPITLIVGEGLEHKIPPEYTAKAEAEYLKHIPRPIDEIRVHFVTYTTKYSELSFHKNKALYVTGLDRHYDKASIIGTVTGWKVDLVTSNVRSFELYFAATPFADAPTVLIDGQVVALPIGENQVLRAEKKEGKWSAITLKLWRDRAEQTVSKSRNRQGPIDDAFMSPFYVVRPTGAGWSPRQVYFFAYAEDQFDRVWDKYFRGKFYIQPTDKANMADKNYNLVLFGDPQSNPLIAQVLPKLPITWTKDTLVVNGKSYDPATHVPVMIYPNPLSPGKYVVLNTGHTFSEKDLQGTNALLYPHLGDWAVIKPKPTKAEPWAYEVVDAGLFDEFWQFPK